MKNEKMVTEVSEFVKTCYSLKPKELFLPELIWKFAIRNVLRAENILLVGPAGSAKTMTAHCIVDALKRPFFNIPLGSTQDPRAALIGNTNFSKEKGTFFSESYFVKAIRTPNAIILLDELSRAHPEAWNILMPVLDSTQRYLRLDEKEDCETVPVAQGVSFISTANIGSEYTSTRVLDRALVDRFTIVEIPCLDDEEEYKLLKQKFDKVDDKLLRAVASIAHTTRKEVKLENNKLNTAISTRASVRIASLIDDGFTLVEAAEVAIYPFFADDGEERTFVKQIVQKFIPNDENEKLFEEKTDDAEDAGDVLFTDEDIANAVV